MEERKIIFVCTGNTCRSPMAEAVLRSEIRRLNIRDAAVFSAGLKASENGNINPNSAAVLSENGLSIDNFSSRELDPDMLGKAYAIICMTDSQRDILMDMRWNILRRAGFSDIENNVFSFSDVAGYEIPDPFGKDLDCYRLTYQKIVGGMSALIEKLFPELREDATEVKAEAEKKETEIKSGKSGAKKTERKKNGEKEGEKKERKPRAKPRKRVTKTAGASGAGGKVVVRTTKKAPAKKRSAGKKKK